MLLYITNLYIPWLPIMRTNNTHCSSKWAPLAPLGITLSLASRHLRPLSLGFRPSLPFPLKKEAKKYVKKLGTLETPVY
jgi:hypothetical protein